MKVQENLWEDLQDDQKKPNESLKKNERREAVSTLLLIYPHLVCTTYEKVNFPFNLCQGRASGHSLLRALRSTEVYSRASHMKCRL